MRRVEEGTEEGRLLVGSRLFLYRIDQRRGPLTQFKRYRNAGTSFNDSRRDVVFGFQDEYSGSCPYAGRNASGHIAILDDIERNDADVFGRRAFVSKWGKSRRLPSILVRSRLGAYG